MKSVSPLRPENSTTILVNCSLVILSCGLNFASPVPCTMPSLCKYSTASLAHSKFSMSENKSVPGDCELFPEPPFTESFCGFHEDGIPATIAPPEEPEPPP